MIIPRLAFYHAFLIGSWEDLVREQIDLLFQRGPAIELNAYVVAPDPHDAKRFDDLMGAHWPSRVPTKVAWAGNECDGIEYLRYNLRYQAVSHPEQAGVLFFHTKGITKPGDVNVQDWRHLMEYFLIDRWQEALLSLAGLDAVGVNYRSLEPGIPDHFSGNFWWSTVAHLRTLPPPANMTDKNTAESWVSSSGNMGSLHESGVNHYRERYPRAIYAAS